MKDQIVQIKSVADLHKFYNYGSPRHPLVSIIDLKNVSRPNANSGNYLYSLDLFTIVFKQYRGSIKYGRSHYDFHECTILLTAPNQGLSPSAVASLDGWFLAFHPDFLSGSDFGKKFKKYSFFNYESNEALHISEDEKNTLRDVVAKIEKEYSQNIDRHTQGLILNQIELLLNYCDRFYDRQFFTRSGNNKDILEQFENLLDVYFNSDTLVDKGIPEVKYFAEKLYLSSNYLSDLLSKHTGKSTLEHIHLKLVEKAKNLLMGTSGNVSEIAYQLGFDHPSHFTKVFKTKAGVSPLQFRKQNGLLN